MDENILDYLTLLDLGDDSKDTIQELIKDLLPCYSLFLSSLIDEDYLIFCAIVNHNVTQEVLASQLRISQVAIRKRFIHCVKRFGLFVLSKQVSTLDLKTTLNQLDLSYTAYIISLLTFQLNSFWLVSDLLNIKKFKIKPVLLETIQKLRQLPHNDDIINYSLIIDIYEKILKFDTYGAHKVKERRK